MNTRRPVASELSVVVPMLNEERAIGDLLLALRSQSVLPGEVLLVDNGSTDSTVERVAALVDDEPPRIRVLREPRPGPSAARNRGVREARGTLLAFTDADCRPSPDWIERVLGHLRGGERVVSGPYVAVQPEGRIARYVCAIQRNFHGSAERTVAPDVRGRHFVGGNFACEKSALLEVGSFDEALRWGEDLDLGARFCERGGGYFYDPALAVAHRVRDDVRKRIVKAASYGEFEARTLSSSIAGHLVLDCHPFGTWRWRTGGRGIHIRVTAHTKVLGLALVATPVLPAISAVMLGVLLGWGMLRVARDFRRADMAIGTVDVAAVGALCVLERCSSDWGRFRGGAREGICCL